MNSPAIKCELCRRAEHYLDQKYLLVDYYRIRRKLAWPLPLRELTLPDCTVAGIPKYPWATWMTWELEERIYALGWVGHWFKKSAARKIVARDLLALAQWPLTPGYLQFNLSLAHPIRTLRKAYVSWPWLGKNCQLSIKKALHELVTGGIPLIDARYGAFRTSSEMLASPNVISLLANIPIIASLAISTAANAICHGNAAKLNHCVELILETLFTMRAKGCVEGVAYDGYILDFLADWLDSLPPGSRSTFLNHPQLKTFLEESYMTCAPGDMLQVAQIGDIEAKEMPFHISAHAKLLNLKENGTSSWYFSRCRIDGMRSDALAALYQHKKLTKTTSKPKSGALNAHYATVLRSGWEPNDLAVVMSSTNSPMGHIQFDNGTMVIGTQGQWILSDPGYQQYMAKSERVFTLGPCAHNFPIINGLAHAHKNSTRSVLETAPHSSHAILDLTACYPKEVALKSVKRNLWLFQKQFVVVGDQIQGDGITEIKYHWHGHPDASWWDEGKWARITLHPTTLWFTSLQAGIGMVNIDRIKGSRGQLTLTTTAELNRPVVWWVFSLDKPAQSMKLDASGKTLQLDGFKATCT